MPPKKMQNKSDLKSAEAVKKEGDIDLDLPMGTSESWILSEQRGDFNLESVEPEADAEKKQNMIRKRKDGVLTV
jgi:hypothetical protein